MKVAGFHEWCVRGLSRAICNAGFSEFGVAVLFFFSQGAGMGSEKSGLTSCQTKIRDDKSDETLKERSQVANWMSLAILIISSALMQMEAAKIRTPYHL